MKSLFVTIRDIYVNDRRVIWWMVLLFLVGGMVAVLTVMNLGGSGADGTIVRYSDGGGYEKGGWRYMLSFAVMGVVLSILHPLVAVRIYEKRGGSATVVFLVVSMLMALVAMLTLMRLVGEG